jgi:hypothetical protein
MSPDPGGVRRPPPDIALTTPEVKMSSEFMNERDDR